MSTFTTSKQLELVARGDDVGTWDTPENSNWSVVDAALGGQSAIPVAGANITLSPAQYQQSLITFTGALLASISVTFPTSFTGPYTIFNNTTGSSAFQITLTTTAAGGTFIGAPPGKLFDAFNTGTGLLFRNLPEIGTYHDFVTSSAPGWIGACSTPPYLACIGGTFSSAAYPVLTVLMGGTTLPDSQGRGRIALDGGTNRVTSAVSGVAGNTRFASGGNQQLQSHQHTGTTGTESATHTHDYLQPNYTALTAVGGSFVTPISNAAGTTTTQSANHTHPFTTDLTGGGGSQNMPPVYVGGITMIRAG